ncbi:MAG: CHRD domain-containing protein, partial [Oligoflexus sp.]|nr:CHRD domain-containing protein [Pseudopedobacter sp.]
NVVATSKQEIPQNISTATATLNGLFDKTTKKLTYTLAINGLTPTVLHLHKGEVGVSGPVNVTLSATGGITDAFTAQQETDLFAGSLYLNIHSATYAGGEIRGQVTTPNQLVFATTANSAAEVPTNSSTATAAIYTLYNKTAKSLAYTINFIGVVPTNMHFHKAAIGVSGPVQIAIPGLYVTGMKGEVTLTADQEVDLFANQWYFNLHSATYAGGEIRGQLVR